MNRPDIRLKTPLTQNYKILRDCETQRVAGIEKLNKIIEIRLKIP